MIWRLLMILPVFFILSCGSTDAVPVVPPRYILQIDYQAGFQNDSVLVAIDGSVLSSGTFVSDSLGFAHSAVVSLLASSHTLQVYAISARIKTRYDTTFIQPSARLYCGVGYGTSSNWVIKFSPQPFSYQPTY